MAKQGKTAYAFQSYAVFYSTRALGSTVTRTNLEELHTYLFGGHPHPLEPSLRAWLRSRRFAAFVGNSRSKVRKKLRASLEPESVLDVRLELETAYLLLQERPFNVVYEPPAAGGARAPDFAVSYTSHSTFMLEVTRLRGDAPKLEHAVCSKLGQLAQGRSNVLLVGFPAPLTDDALRTVMADLQRRAERHDSELLKRSKLQGWSDFFRHYGRLSEVLVRPFLQETENQLAVWVNPQAKQPLSSKIRTALYRSQRTL